MIDQKGEEKQGVYVLAGADDYLSKPFGVGELLARVRPCVNSATPQTAIQFGHVKVGLKARLATKEDQHVHRPLLSMTCYARW